MARRADPDRFVSIGLDALPGDARKRNGEYRGTARVRVIPPGMTGEDLRALDGEPLAVGQHWHRGEQLVRVLAVTRELVTFVELTNGHARRVLERRAFMKHAKREVA